MDNPNLLVGLIIIKFLRNLIMLIIDPNLNYMHLLMKLMRLIEKYNWLLQLLSKI
jgi:hypothetical protein